MPEHESAAGLLLAAMLVGAASMGYLALSMPAHAAQVWGRAPSLAVLRLLRWMGGAGIVVALVLCLRADHPSMAVLVWVMTLSGAGMLTALLLASHPRWLRMLAPWVRPPAQADVH